MAGLAITGNDGIIDNFKTSFEPVERKKLRYPMPVFFIVVTEFCERFAYYGMRAVLTIYMRSVLNFSDDLATIIYHIFLFLCYFLPIFGAILADSFVGKYTTVFLLSSIFAGGNILLTAASTPPLHLPTVAFSLTGLALMAIGTGGIKPCVVALGGDQFILPHQEHQLKQFFSIFVFAVSVGNMLSTVITPVLRSDVQCFNHDCYPLAFGIPAILMVVAICIFMAGKPMYKINQPKDNIILRVVQCMTHALSQRRIQKKKTHPEESSSKKEHWVDYAHYDGSKFDKQLIQDTKGLLRVLVYYLPVPMFWALYEQLVSNAILMFIFIPVFETMLYPLLRKCNIFQRPLQRMGVGGLLAALSFFLAGIIEMRIERSFIAQPALMETHLNIINTLPCHLTIYSEDEHFPSAELNHGFLTVPPGNNIVLHSITQRNVTLSFATFYNDTTSNCFPISTSDSPPSLNPLPNDTLSWSGIISTSPGVMQSIIVALNPQTRALQPYPLSIPEDITKSRLGFAKLRPGSIAWLGRSTRFCHVRIDVRNHRKMFVTSNVTSQISDNVIGMTIKEIIKLEELEGNLSGNESPNFKVRNRDGDKSYSVLLDSQQELSSLQIPPDMYKIESTDNLAKISRGKFKGISNDYLNLEIGGNYLVILSRDPSNGLLKQQLITVVPPNEVNMLWLLPQYVVMAWAEILFIISGMEFSFTEAPKSMKSVLQSCWHLTNATGNLLVIIAAKNKGQNSQATEFLIFASLMLIDTVIFAVMASRYKYVSESKYDDDADDVGKESSRYNKVEDKTLSKDHHVITPTNSNDAQVTRM